MYCWLQHPTVSFLKDSDVPKQPVPWKRMLAAFWSFLGIFFFFFFFHFEELVGTQGCHQLAFADLLPARKVGSQVGCVPARWALTPLPKDAVRGVKRSLLHFLYFLYSILFLYFYIL